MNFAKSILPSLHFLQIKKIMSNPPNNKTMSGALFAIFELFDQLVHSPK